MSKLVDQPTNRTARKVQAASLAGTGGTILGAWVASMTFGWLPDAAQVAEGAYLGWTFLISGSFSWIASLGVGRAVRERLENMLMVK